MTGEQYVRANKRVYNVVMILLSVMTILSVMACLAEFKITILIQAVAAGAGIIVVNTYAKKFWNSKKGGEILLGTGSAVYCVFLFLNQNNFVYAYGIPLFVACVLYLNVKFVYYGIGVTAVGNIIHIIVQVITKRADGVELFFSIIILATVVYAVYEASILLTKFNEENLEMQAAASEKMLATAENLVKHFDSAKEKLETLEEVINNNNESISNIAQSTGSTAEAIQQQALMCEEIHKNTDSAEKETEAMIDKANHTMENVAEGARLVTGLKNQADNVEQASNQAAESTKQVSNRVEEVKGIVATILSIRADALHGNAEHAGPEQDTDVVAVHDGRHGVGHKVGEQGAHHFAQTLGDHVGLGCVGQHHRNREHKAGNCRQGCCQKGGEHVQPDHRAKAAVQPGRTLCQGACHDHEHQHRGNALQCADEQAAELSHPTGTRGHQCQHHADCQAHQDTEDQADAVVLCNSSFQGLHTMITLLFMLYVSCVQFSVSFPRTSVIIAQTVQKRKYFQAFSPLIFQSL